MIYFIHSLVAESIDWYFDTDDWEGVEILILFRSYDMLGRSFTGEKEGFYILDNEFLSTKLICYFSNELFKVKSLFVRPLVFLSLNTFFPFYYFWFFSRES